MSNDFMMFAEEFADLHRQKREIESSLEPIQKRINELQGVLLQAHETSGIGSSVKLASGGTIVISEKTGVKKTDEAALLAWLDANGMGELAKRSVNTNSLGALVRERLDRFEAAPDGCEATHYKTVTFRAG